MADGKRKRFIEALSLAGALAVAGLILTAQGKPGASLAGLTSKDAYPNGCIDCHLNAGANRDTRLNVVLAAREGHPPVDKIVNLIPGDCLKCHKAGAKAGAFNLITHRQHYRNPSANEFISRYQGACLNCHTLAPDTGVMTVKSGKKNW